jgi:hypothetical protein
MGDYRDTKEYRAWRDMRARIHTPRPHQRKSYRGKRLGIDSEWDASFGAFLRDVGAAPSSAHTLGRKDNSLGYVPGNVSWETRKQQQRNRDCARWVVVAGRRRLFAEVVDEAGVSYSSAYSLWRRGIPIEVVLASARKIVQPKAESIQNEPVFTGNGVKTREVCRVCGVTARQLQYWDERRIIRAHHDERGRRVYSPDQLPLLRLVARFVAIPGHGPRSALKLARVALSHAMETLSQENVLVS